MKLEGRVAIVTGSSTGIGEAIAEAFAAEGARLVVNSRSAQRAASVAERLTQSGAEAIAVGADVSRKAECERLVAAAFERWGRVDVMVNNAGVNAIRPSLDLSEEDWRRVIDTNLSGVFFGCQAAGKVMLSQGSGVIVNVSSVYGHVGVPRRAAYASTKHGLLGMTKVLAVEWARLGVRVVSLDPGYIKTPLDEQDQATGDYTDADIIRRTPMGRFGTLADVAKAAVFLASDDAGYVTGSSLAVDGGWLAYGAW
jgi:NAD(P)-dependent dehydrogenase (short-subunit alcohol dehydrogenase family)